MKKSLILGLFGMAVTVVSTYAQGYIALDNYNTATVTRVTYGANVPANGSSGALGTPGTGVRGLPWTAGLYFVQGDVTGLIAADPTGFADPASLGGGLVLGTGLGSTAVIGEFLRGEFAATSAFQATSDPSGTVTVTVMVVAYSGANYASSNYRGHSAPFTMGTLPGTSFPNNVGNFMSSFSVVSVPEPSIFVLSGLGAAALLLIRRKKSV